MSGVSALVTGGAGFIGSHLVDRLVAEGFRVRVLDDFSSGREDNLAGCLDRVELLRGDVRDAQTVARALDGVELVFHQGAIASANRSVDEPVRCEDVNVRGTLTLLEAARRAGVRRLVLAASCAVYGNADASPRREDGAPQPASPYALQKYAAEQYCRLYTELHGLETVALRYFNTYGPRQDPNGDYAAVVPRFVHAGLKGDPVRIHGDGDQTRDFVSVGDVVGANLLAARARAAVGRVVNVASGQQTSINELAQLVGALTGSSAKPRGVAPRPGDVRHSVADLSLARELLGYRPSVELREGLSEVVQSMRGAAAGGSDR